MGVEAEAGDGPAGGRLDGSHGLAVAHDRVGRRRLQSLELGLGHKAHLAG